MNEANIGSRIRDLRQKKGMTQKELAGDHITRNMLSLIESGTAVPSLSTLCYLAEKLDIPTGYFFINSPEEEKNYHKAAVIDRLKQAFVEKDYEKCTELCSLLPLTYADDEISMIAAIAYLKSAIGNARRYAISRASMLLAKASDYSHRTVYLGHSFHLGIDYYTKLFRYLNTSEIPPILTELSYASEYVPYEMILYFGILKIARDAKNVTIPFIGGTLYEKHIDAILLMNNGKWNQALLVLKALSKDSQLPYFMQYKVLCDLETAANQVGDIRSAYVSARKKLELIEGVE